MARNYPVTQNLVNLVDAQRILLEARKSIGITRPIEDATAWTFISDAFMHLQDNFQNELAA